MDRDAALRWLLSHGRPLERARLIEDGPARRAAVTAALRAHQQPDGGLGGPLEPDHRYTGSTVLATWSGLAVCRDEGLDASDPLVAQLLAWSRERLVGLDGHRVWPFLPPEAQQAAHAPWWDQSTPGQLAASFAGFRLNPRAELVAMAWRWPGFLDAVTRDALTVDVVAAVERMEPGHVHDHLCASTFAHEPAVPAEARAAVVDVLHHVLPARVQRPGAAGYGLDALDVVPGPDSPLVDVVSDVIADTLDSLDHDQTHDGSWRPGWVWDHPAGPGRDVVSDEWASVVTLESVRRLDRWDAWRSSRARTAPGLQGTAE